MLKKSTWLVKAEMHQAVVEVGTDICQDIDEAMMDVATLRKTISSIAGDLGLWVGASGTHPFSHWESQLITDHARYSEIVNELQEAARSNLIFGLHVHVGMENRELAMHIANSARYFLPHIYALSTNSPFWEGRLTGYKSIAALFQGICAKLYKLRLQNLNFIMYPRILINENKWRAGRYGIDGSMIDFGREAEVNTRVLIYELLDFIDDVTGPLGIKNAMGHVHKMLEQGTGADRQLKVFEQTNSLVDVVDYIHSQFLSGI